MYFFDTVGQWLISVYGHGQQVDEMRELYREWGHWIILIKGMTPIPYKVVTIASGLAGYSLFWFIVLSLITRAVRFFAVAGIFNRFGPSMKPFIEANLGLVTAIMVAFIIGGFVLVKYVV
jgi:membrane protein YqaA with SNARE-associated domain